MNRKVLVEFVCCIADSLPFGPMAFREAIESGLILAEDTETERWRQYSSQPQERSVSVLPIDAYAIKRGVTKSQAICAVEQWTSSYGLTQHQIVAVLTSGESRKVVTVAQSLYFEFVFSGKMFIAEFCWDSVIKKFWIRTYPREEVGDTECDRCAFIIALRKSL